MIQIMKPAWKMRLKRVMDERSINRKALSKAIKATYGLNERLVYDLLNGTDNPRIDTLAAVAATLGLSLGELYDGDNPNISRIPIVGAVSAGEGWTPSDDDTGDFAMDVGRRLRWSRQAIGIDDQKRFGEDAGLHQSLYNRFESGKRLLTLQSAMQLCYTHNLTLDWLYRGDPSGLPYGIANKIKAIRRERTSLKS